MLYEVITFDRYCIDTVIFVSAVVPLDIFGKRLFLTDIVDSFGHA